MANESDLRKWLKGIYGDELRWVEAGFGGSAGLPDVNVPYGQSLAMPVELKMWERYRDGSIKFEIRPVQRRYHIMEARSGRRTAFLAGVKNGNGTFDVIAFAGKYCPLGLRDPELVTYTVAVLQKRKVDWSDTYRRRILGLLTSENFWNGVPDH